MKFFKNLLLPFVLLSLTGCALGEGFEHAPAIKVPDGVSGISLPISRVALFAELSEYNLLSSTPETRASEEQVTLRSLLELDAVTTRIIGDRIYTQIPFLQNKDEIYASINSELAANPEYATKVKKFLITVQGGAETEEYVATMVTDYVFYENNPNFDFLNKSNYTGQILISAMDGTLKEACTCKGGLCLEGFLLTKEDLELVDAEMQDNIHYVLSFELTERTRALQTSSMDATLTGGYCSCDDWRFYQWLRQQRNLDLDADNLGGTGSGGAAGPGPNSGSGSMGQGGAAGNGNSTSKATYNVQVASNIPEEVRVNGSGPYFEGTTIAISCWFTAYYKDIPFSRWVGDFAGNGPDFTWTVTKNVTSTAYFGDSAPCYDKDKKVYNPLNDMRIAGTKEGGPTNGLFDAVRGINDDGTLRKHAGVDFCAEPGTSIYASYDGVVVFVDDLQGNSKQSFGNRIVIGYDIPGQSHTVYFQYSHLDADKPIAINPQTKASYTKDNKVFAGDLIGYTGRTGNASDETAVPNAHLDLTVSYDITPEGKLVKGTSIDPMQFLNGTVDAPTINQTNGRIDNIKCN